MNFLKGLINCIMNCVSSDAFSLLLNGQVSTNINVQRGLKQGDPLSPYLFILSMNVYSCLTADAEANNHCNGISFARRGLAISHFMYANDLILFFKADDHSPGFIKHTLDTFYDKAGLSINVQKSNLVMTPNTPRDVKASLSQLFEVGATDKLGKYLGVFIDDRKDLKQNFDYLLGKINRRLAGWKSHLLSQAGRVTLIKSIMQSGLVYKLSCFHVPARVTDALNGAMTNFFLGF